MAPVEKINLNASDGIAIVANLYPVPNPKGWLLLTHTMPATKESWSGFAETMRKYDYESLAIDLRGHGESQGGPDGYKKFTDAEHQASIGDLEAAWEFLKSRGATPDMTTVVGASIGANLSLQFLAAHPDIAKGVLLSAGTEYHGVATEASAAKLSANQSMVLATSKDDDGNVTENQVLYKALPAKMNKHLIIFERGGHGTAMLSSDEFDLSGAILKFLDHGSVN